MTLGDLQRHLPVQLIVFRWEFLESCVAVAKMSNDRVVCGLSRSCPAFVHISWCTVCLQSPSFFWALMGNGCLLWFSILLCTFLADHSACAILLVAHLAHCVFSLSVICLSVYDFCIVAKWYVLAKNCLKERIGNRGQKVDFLGSRHISTSSFASTPTEMAVLPYFCRYSPTIGTR